MAFSVWWRITRSSRFGRCRSVGEIAVTGDCFQRNLGNGFDRVWRVAGSPCRVLRLSACCVLRASTARALARSCRSSGVRRTRFGVSDTFGFAAVAGDFETFGAGAGAAAGLAGCFFFPLGSGSWS